MNRQSGTTFSITIPTYNRAHLLPRAIKSVLAQTFTNFALIIVDDGSTDDTQAVVESFADPRIKYVYQPNSGAGVARNLGARISASEYVTFLDSDDEAAPTWLEHYYEAFNCTHADVICCGFERIAYDGARLAQAVVVPKNLGPLFGGQVGLFTHGGTFALRREVFQTVGGYAPALAAGQHSELAMRLIPLCRVKGWTIHNIDMPLIRYHLHSGPRIRKSSRAKYNGIKYVLENHKDLFKQAPKIHATYLTNIGVNAAHLENYKEARKYIFASLAIYPWNWRTYGRLLLTLVPTLGRKVWK